jgi:predicted DNA-binding transcriptional regulator AlpA
MTHAIRPARLLYPYAEAAMLLGLPSIQALRDLVHRGKGPVKVRIGRRVLFAASDIEAWIAAHRAPHEQVAEPIQVTTRKRSRGRPSVAERQAATSA